MERIVITGATGMIGSSLIKILKEKDVEIFAISRPNSKKSGNVPEGDNIRVIECDISNLSSLSSKLSDCDLFFHFAWTGTVGEARDNADIQLNNIKYSLDAVKLAKDIGCSTFVGAGSQAEYGFVEEKLSNSTPVNPVTSYGIAKYSAGKLSRVLASQLGIKHCWGRILSVYGPGDNQNTMVMSCINSILNNNPFDTTKADQVWDYIYSDDCAQAFYDIAKKGHDGEVYTIGSGSEIPLKDYISAIRDVINPDFEIGFGNIDYYPNQVMYLSADISKLMQDTGFKPEISFEEGIRRIVEDLK